MPVRIGFLTPSSNTVVEPATIGMLAGLDDVSPHFARFRVTQIAGSPEAMAQFADAPLLEAASLLADARMDVIAYAATSSALAGLDHGRGLVKAVEAATDTPCVTSMLSLMDALAAFGVRRIGLVTPFTSDVQAMVVNVLAAEGIETVGERHAGIRVNFDFSLVTADWIERSAEAVARGAEAVVTLSTNLAGAPVAAGLEARLGLPVLDTQTTVVWAALKRAGIEPSRVVGWGSLFAR